MTKCYLKDTILSERKQKPVKPGSAYQIIRKMSELPFSLPNVSIMKTGLLKVSASQSLQ